MMNRTLSLALGIMAIVAGPALGHVTLDRAELPADSSVRVALRVNHGCGGAATTALRVTVPPELRGVRPMPHAGWALAVGGVAVAGGHGDHAAHVAAAAAAPGEIAWTGGRLDDAFYDEFVLLVRTPAEPGTVIRFPVVQECEGGAVSRWTAAAPAQAAGAGPAPAARIVARTP